MTFFCDFTSADAALFSHAAHMKRFCELMEGDPDFRALAQKDAPRAAREWDLRISDSAASYLALTEAQRAAVPPPDDIAPLALYIEEKRLHRQRIRERAAACGDERFRAWHARQLARCTAELGARTNAMFTHQPFIMELSHGCSVGCPFCGLSAGRLKSVFRATDENLRLFCDILAGAQARFGDALRDAILYYATEPLDNPDYLAFANAFASAAGTVPTLTTAVALRDLRRTREVISIKCAGEPTVHRLSLLTLNDFRSAARALSPEETLFTEFLPRYPEASLGLVRSGRALHAGDAHAELLFTNQGTVACISGFIVNLAERTVRISTPCRADDARPNGSIEAELGAFDTADELFSLIDARISRMGTVLDAAKPVALASFLQAEETAAGVALTNPGVSRITISDPDAVKLVHHITGGRATGDELIEAMRCDGIEPFRTQLLLQSFYQNGLIEETL